MSTQQSALALAQQTYDAIAKWDGGQPLPTIAEQLAAKDQLIAAANAERDQAVSDRNDAVTQKAALQTRLDNVLADITQLDAQDNAQDAIRAQLRQHITA